MADVIIMPKLGFNMSEGKLVKWYKEEGDPIKKGEPVFSIETDKTAIDIEATSDGVFRKKFLEEGDSIEVTLPIAIIAGADENIDDAIKDVEAQLNKGTAPAESKDVETKKEEAVEAPAATKVESVGSRKDGILKITPRARRIAAENGLELAGLEIQGTGYQGGISEKDILEYLASNKVKASPVARKMAAEQGIALDSIQGTGASGKVMKKDVADLMAPAARAAVGSDESGLAVTQDGKVVLEAIEYTGVRKIIGDRLCQSKFTAPHLYFTQKVDMDKVLDLRKQVNGAQDHKTSVTDFIARACVKAMKKFPDMNSALIGDTIEKYKYVNLGIAVAAPGGLIVPVVKQADNLSVVELSKEAKVLFDKARAGSLIPDEYSGGTFSISNLGMFGIENFTAILNPPEAGILSISSTKDEPVVVKDEDGCKEVVIRPMMNMTLTVDHRLIDGLLAAQFVTEVKRLLENPIEILI